MLQVPQPSPCALPTICSSWRRWLTAWQGPRGALLLPTDKGESRQEAAGTAARLRQGSGSLVGRRSWKGDAMPSQAGTTLNRAHWDAVVVDKREKLHISRELCPLLARSLARAGCLAARATRVWEPRDGVSPHRVTAGCSSCRVAGCHSLCMPKGPACRKRAAEE